MKILLALILALAAILALDVGIVVLGGQVDPTPAPLVLIWQVGLVVLAVLVAAALVLGISRLLARRHR